MKEIDVSSVRSALKRKYEKEIGPVHYDTTVLQGGTVGEVVRLTGEAESGNERLPFTLVLKTQKKWDRHGDPDCWRREYDIYRQQLPRRLSQTVRLPLCYLLEEDADTTRIYMENIEGRTGNTQLHENELGFAARSLGALQADFHLHGEKDLGCLRPFPAVRSSFDLWYGRMGPLLQNPMEGFPEEIRQTLNQYAGKAPELLRSFDRLPHTLCQGDVHHDNLILRDGPEGTQVYLIDWDSAGYGCMGEDAVDVLMEAFVYSDREVSLFPLFRQTILDGYCAGARAGGVDFAMSHELFRDLAVLSWGFRVADLYLYYSDEPSKNRCIQILREILEEDPS